MDKIEETAENTKNEIKDSANEVGNKIEYNLDNIQNIPNEIRNASSDMSEEKFLFFFNPDVDEKTICGITQKLTVQILSIIALICSISYFLSALKGEFFFDGIYEIIVCVIFLIIAFYGFFSALNDNSDYAKISYIAATILWLIFCIEYVIETIVDIIKFLNVFGDDFLRVKEIFKDIGEGCILLIFLYFVWILYCFMINLKSGKSV